MGSHTGFGGSPPFQQPKPYRMLHLVAYEKASLPQMARNTYIQYEGNMLGQYDANAEKEPPILPFDAKARETIARQFNEDDCTVHCMTN